MSKKLVIKKAELYKNTRQKVEKRGRHDDVVM